jgi:DUF2075 family protein
MTRSEISRVDFDHRALDRWARGAARHANWPVVYVIDGTSENRPSLSKVYVGESLNAGARMRQHLESGTKSDLRTVRAIINDRFNKSVCLDLESYLIRLFSGDGAYEVVNLNGGITDSDYFDREIYIESFAEIFDQLRSEGLFTRSIAEIENSDLFKLSPFKALTQDQAIAVEDILDGLFADLASDTGSTTVVAGGPGTGKTIVGIYLMKLLKDIEAASDDDMLDRDWMFSEFFAEGYRELLGGIRIGLVIPQQSLRTSVQGVFRRTPRLTRSMAVSPFDVGKADDDYDLLIVDETHRLNQRANQPSGVLNADFRAINERLFGADDTSKTQLDWIKARSKHQIFLVDGEQSVRPADLPGELLASLVDAARAGGRYYALTTQMRVRAGEDYVEYIRRVLRPVAGAPTLEPRSFAEYDLRLFDDVSKMRAEIVAMDQAHGLARLVAGYAWEWKSRKDPSAYDIELDGCRFRWNTTIRDWINSPGSLEEVGSIHTVQGYDLNYAGVIIGPELRWDPVHSRPYIDRSSYRDTKGKENNPALGKTYSDDDLLRFIVNIYGVLLTRGMLGTFVYVCDPALRQHLSHYIRR